MASEFSVRVKTSVIPIETVTLADGTDTASAIQSTIDKTLGSSLNRVVGDTAGTILYTSYDTTTGEVAFNHATLFDSAVTTAQIDMIYLSIKTALGIGTPNVYISFDEGATYNIIASFVGGVMILPCYVVGGLLRIKTVGATQTCTCDIMVTIET